MSQKTDQNRGDMRKAVQADHRNARSKVPPSNAHAQERAIVRKGFGQGAVKSRLGQ
jgi:hypothetical protein